MSYHYNKHQRGIKRYKNILIIIGIIILLYSVFAFDLFGIKTTITDIDKKKIGQNFNSSQDIIYDNCENVIRQLIPKYFLVLEEEMNYKDGVVNYWKDGTPFKGLISENCLRQGSEKGENINYFYTNPIEVDMYLPVPACIAYPGYYKKIISDNGEVLREVNIDLLLILKESDVKSNIENYKNYEIVDYKIIRCNL